MSHAVGSRLGPDRDGATSSTPAILGRRDRCFFTSMALAAGLAVCVGFAPTFYLRPTALEPLPPYLHVHGVLFTAWIVFFLAQTTLVASGRTSLHRRLGWAGVALAVAMVAAGTTAGIWSMQREIANGHEDAALAFLTTPFSAMLVFAALVGAAVVWRRRPATHKRLMLLATISILDAAVARWPLRFTADWMFYALTDLFIVAAVTYDLVARRRLAPAYFWGGLLIIVAQWSRPVVGQTEAWQAFARAIVK
jgi:hypothetical protein